MTEDDVWVSFCSWLHDKHNGFVPRSGVDFSGHRCNVRSHRLIMDRNVPHPFTLDFVLFERARARDPTAAEELFAWACRQRGVRL